MVQASDIRQHMEVLGSDGQHVGTVDHVDGSNIKLARKDSGDGQHHYVPLSSVSRVDARVHLSTTAAVALAGAAGLGAAAAGTAAGTHDHGPLPPVKNRAVDDGRPRGNFYLPWIVGVIGLILLLFLLTRACSHHDNAAPAPADTNTAAATPALPVESVALPGGTTLQLAPNTLNYDLQRYLASNEPTPKAFQFDKLNFDTSSAAIRPEDQPNVDALAQILAAYPNAHVKIVGYTDARGTAPANDQLGQQRADAVTAALVAKGIDKGRIEATTGGETHPTDTNATAQGQFDNRRTELVVTAK